MEHFLFIEQRVKGNFYIPNRGQDKGAPFTKLIQHISDLNLLDFTIGFHLTFLFKGLHLLSNKTRYLKVLKRP